MEITLLPIGVVRNKIEGKRDDHWGHIESEIHLDSERFTDQALVGLDEFSHVEVIFQFHFVADQDPVHGTRHPRGNEEFPKVGIFAQRGKDRPNHLGATVCKVIARDKSMLKVRGLDAFDGSPVLDIKPVMREFTPERNEINQPEWATQLMSDYF
jgi:tRNA-Thr(GGU) m(6)t(6)A37 methyltransferase TsaA